ncbi:MAG: zinc metalloprotease HtpX [Hyphomicrobiaceae bacterium]
MSPFLDAGRLAEHRRRNFQQSVALVATISLVAMLSAALIWSWPGAVGAGLLVAALALIGPRVPPDAVMRLYNGVQVDARHGAQLHRIVEVLAERAELGRHPRLFVIPSLTLNAFAAGTPSNAAIGITEGLLRRLDLRQVAGVIAHEMSHIRNNDLRVMAMADALTRFTQLLAYLGLLLAVLNVPALMLGLEPFPWLGIVGLYLAPMLASLLQMGLSRTREYDADIEAAGLTGDPAGLAAALGALERYQGRFWEDLMLPVPGRRVPYPSLLRSHPETADRIARLAELERRPHRSQPLAFPDEPLFTLVGLGPASMSPRYRTLGLWY